MEHLENNSSEIQPFLSKPSNFLTRQGIFQQRNQLNTTHERFMQLANPVNNS